MNELLNDIRGFLVDNATLLSALGGLSGVIGFVWMRILRPLAQALGEKRSHIKIRDVYGACKSYLTPGEELSLERLREKGYFND